MSSESTQLISAQGYDTSRMIFSEPQIGSIPDSKPAITYKRINIQTQNDDGSFGDLILSTDELYSFGVSESTNIETGKVNGYSMALCLYNKDGARPSEKAFVETFNNIVEKCKDYLIENKEELDQYDLEKSDLKKFNPLYYKKVGGKVVDGASPTLYAKLIVSKKQDKIITVFFDKESGETMDALSLLGKYCNVRAAIKIESIFIGNKISLQVKLYECEVKVINYGMKRLLSRPESGSGHLLNVPVKKQQVPLSMDDDDSGSLIDDDNFDDDVQLEESIKTVPKKVVKKVVKKVAK